MRSNSTRLTHRTILNGAVAAGALSLLPRRPQAADCTLRPAKISDPYAAG